MKQDRFRSMLHAALAIAAVCVIAGCIIAPETFLDRRVWLRGYTIALLFWLDIALGSLLWLAIHELSGGAWGGFIRGCLQAAASTLPLMAVLFMPLLSGAALIYPWHQAEMHVSAHQSAYLGGYSVGLRTLVFFGLWLWVAAMLRVRTPEHRARLGRRAAGCIILLSLSISLFSIDWILALDPAAGSTMIGFSVMAGQLAGALAFAILYVAAKGRGQDAVEEADRLHDLGNLLLTAVLLYAYILYMDYLIVWSGNLPREIHWYLQRSDIMGLTVAGGLIGLHIALPLLLLLSRRVKRSARALGWVACLVLCGQLLNTYWLLQPLYRYGGAEALPCDLFLLLLTGTAWLRVFTRFSSGRPRSGESITGARHGATAN
jgi:hypothetical protein